jgi:acetyl esterase/lipase
MAMFWPVEKSPAEEPLAHSQPLRKVKSVKDVPYVEGDDAHPTKHFLDVYFADGAKDCPVIFFVHGGAWKHGDRNFFGIYARIGEFWARQGCVAVVPSYRLSPTVKHPQHVRDVARAFAWTKANVAKHGGRADRILIVGHSAGAHLVALLAANDTYLKAEGCSTNDIRGVIALSGPYRIPENNPFFNPVFGDDPQTRRDASPILHVRENMPPFLVVFSGLEMPYCGKKQALEFAKTLEEKKCSVTTCEIPHRNHLSILLHSTLEDDPAARAMLEFLRMLDEK